MEKEYGKLSEDQFRRFTSKLSELQREDGALQEQLHALTDQPG